MHFAVPAIFPFAVDARLEDVAVLVGFVVVELIPSLLMAFQEWITFAILK